MVGEAAEAAAEEMGRGRGSGRNGTLGQRPTAAVWSSQQVTAE